MIVEIEHNDCGYHCQTKFWVYVDDLSPDDIEVEDFGDIVYGNDSPDYGCESRRFRRALTPASEILDKYHITAEDFAEICAYLEEHYRFSSCDDCS